VSPSNLNSAFQYNSSLLRAEKAIQKFGVISFLAIHRRPPPLSSPPITNLSWIQWVANTK